MVEFVRRNDKKSEFVFQVYVIQSVCSPFKVYFVCVVSSLMNSFNKFKTINSSIAVQCVYRALNIHRLVDALYVSSWIEPCYVWVVSSGYTITNVCDLTKNGEIKQCVFFLLFLFVCVRVFFKNLSLWYSFAASNRCEWKYFFFWKCDTINIVHFHIFVFFFRFNSFVLCLCFWILFLLSFCGAG